MLSVKSFTFNAFQENTYLIINNFKQCWIVDPGMYETREKEYFFKYIEDNQLLPKAIINTHAHIDHILGVQAVIDRYDIPFSIHEKDIPLLNAAAGSAAIFGFELNSIPKPTSYIKETEPLMLGDEQISVRFVPGHSPGSIAFYYEPGSWVIAGDVLFQGSVGRTDLPGGNFDTLVNSIRTQLFTLNANTVVYPGHGPATNVEEEQLYNPFLK